VRGGTSLALLRRMHDARFATRYFVGHGIDIGAGGDGLDECQHFFPQMTQCDRWDYKRGDGDAMLMEGVEDGTYDFVYSSHLLEHVTDPPRALGNWLRILRVGGYLVVVVPEWEMYEHGWWPSKYNPDHKSGWRIQPRIDDPPQVIGVMDILGPLNVDVLKIEQLDHGFQPEWPRTIDQTSVGTGECGIEFVVRKR
jgi:SAM-dependent methyltransferase